jgi:Holliday junction resolvase RusA-like endonuclease
VPITRPDLLKLTRLLEDACSGIIWRDDAQISDELLMKRYAAPPLHPIGVHVRIDPLDPSPRYGTPFLRPLDLSAAVR